MTSTLVISDDSGAVRLQAIAGAQTLDREGLKDRFAEISARNRDQIQQS